VTLWHGRSLAFYKDVLGFRVFDKVPGSLSGAGAGAPRSAVVGFSEAGTKVRGTGGGGASLRPELRG
jgi:hypothetical protein